tara:strand:+ start:772 stop:1074 length:303 start_codon:yes stop_codon:yes gene_type:complete
MKKFEENSALQKFELTNQVEKLSTQENSLRSEVEKALRRYFDHIEEEPVTDLHRMVISEVEIPLFEAVMKHTGNNQSKASVMLGLNRGTLRTKLKGYGLL